MPKFVFLAQIKKRAFKSSPFILLLILSIKINNEPKSLILVVNYFSAKNNLNKLIVFNWGKDSRIELFLVGHLNDAKEVSSDINKK